MATDLPTGTVTFLFTDIEGSAQLLEREPGRIRPALAQHDAILQQAVAAHHGVHYEIFGDAIQAAFALPADAQAAALVAQTTLSPWTPLFATAAAVVTDTGGVLCRSAIVARE